MQIGSGYTLLFNQLVFLYLLTLNGNLTMDSKNPHSQWDLIIKSKSPVLDLKFHDLWRYRDLLLLFVKRDFVSFYKQTVLGPLWFFIQPLFTSLVYTFVFGNLAKISTDGLPQQLFYLSGITAWNYFADCLTKTSTVFKDNASIFGKVYFPRLIMPLSVIVSNLVRLGVQLILLVILMIYYATQGANFQITSAILYFPLLVVLMAFLGLGMGLIITAMTTKYRDLSFLVSFGVQLLMYSTTVIYPLSAASEKYKFFIQLNPMTSIIEAFRFAFLGKGEFTTWSICYSVVVTLVVFFLGIVIFNKTERNFIDTI
jgi:lipopolysaccharide transport system permease protein